MPQRGWWEEAQSNEAELETNLHKQFLGSSSSHLRVSESQMVSLKDKLAGCGSHLGSTSACWSLLLHVPSASLQNIRAVFYEGKDISLLCMEGGERDQVR